MTLTANAGAKESSPFSITAADTDKFSFSLTGLTESSTISFSTDPDFGGASNSTSGRAIMWGFELK